MKKLTAREVQLGELEVLKQLSEICKKQNLRWFLMYGTLIGAVRHHGFIPWDDDVDVCMPRPDYNRLIQYLMDHEEEIKPLRLMSYKTNKDYIYPISRLCDTRYYIDYENALDYGLGLFVDIYPFDGGGNTDEEFSRTIARHQKDVMLADLAGRKKFELSYQGWWRTPIKLMVYTYAKLKGAQYFIRRLDLQAQECKYETSRCIGEVVWDYQDKPFLKEWFDETVYLDFEGEKMPAPKEYDAILKLVYGDYMQMPPEEDRVGHHYYTAYLKDET